DSSRSASGMNLIRDDLRFFIKPIVGMIVTTVSPKSWKVLSLSSICSSAILALDNSFVTFLTSANSFDNTLLVVRSCCCVAVTILLNNFSSLCFNFVIIPSSLPIWVCSLLMADSILGFRGPFGLIASLNLSPIVGVCGLCQLLANVVMDTTKNTLLISGVKCGSL